MNPKQILKIVIDVAMTVLLLLLMAYSLVGEAAHEWLGVAMFLLFVTHHVLNSGWCRSLFKGRYPPLRVFQTALVLLVLIFMVGSMASGVVLSRYVFDLNVRGLSSLAHSVHMLCAYWGFAAMSLHLGLHWNMMLSMAGKMTKRPSARRKWLLRALAALIVLYGAYAFYRRDFWNYMLLRYHFVFFDFEEPLALFLLDYVAVMGLFVCVGHYAAKGLRKLQQSAGRPAKDKQ